MHSPAVMLSSLPTQAAREHLHAALERPQSIAPLPRVCAQLAELTSKPVTDASQLARLIESDPVLSGELMRVANSPPLRPRAPIVTLTQAVSWLGVAEVRNLSMAVMLRGEVFVAPGHEPESEELWREAWLGGLWAKEIARERRRHIETAFLAALMHRSGAALALKTLSSFEAERRTVMDARHFGDLVVEFEAPFGRLLMQRWCMPSEVQEAASAWRSYRDSSQSDLAGTVYAAHLLASHTMHPALLEETTVLDSAVFEQLGMFGEARRGLLEKRERVRSLAGL